MANFVSAPLTEAAMNNCPPPDAVLQLDGSFLCLQPSGSSIRYSRYLNGEWRRPERRRAGWVGDLEVERYRPPHRRSSTLSQEKQLQLLDSLAAHIAVSLRRSKGSFLLSPTVSSRIWSFLGPALRKCLACHIGFLIEAPPGEILAAKVGTHGQLSQPCSTPEDTKCASLLVASISSGSCKLQHDVESSVSSSLLHCLEYGWELFLTCLRRSSDSEVASSCVTDTSSEQLAQSAQHVDDVVSDMTGVAIVSPDMCQDSPATKHKQDCGGLPCKPAVHLRCKSGEDTQRLQLLQVPTPARVRRCRANRW